MASRIVTVFEILIVATLFSLFAALGITTTTNDKIIENTESFVELVRYKGCITQDWYYDFIDSFDSPVDVRIEVTRTPELATADTGTTLQFTQDVIDAIDGPDHIYKMNVGDEINVTVRKPSGNYYDNIVGVFTGQRAKGGNPAIAIKGGMILNTQYSD